MSRIDLQLTVAPGSRCWGVGFMALDIVVADTAEFAATGGSCGNVMAILRWLGWDAAPIARVGMDVAGDWIRKELIEQGVDTQFLSVEAGVQTPIVVQRFVTKGDGSRGHRFSLTCPDCGAWLPRHRPITLRQAAAPIESGQIPNAYYFDRVSPGALLLAKRAREQGALVVFEPSSIGDEKKFCSAVELCHVLKYSQDRLGHVPDLAFAKSPRIIVETQGELGLRFRWCNRWTHLDAFIADPLVDAAGSGDWCTAVLIHLLGHRGSTGLEQLRKGALISALRLGQASAAINCQYLGARGSMLAMPRLAFNRKLRQLAGRPEAVSVDVEPTLDALQPPGDFCLHCDDSRPRVNDRRVAAQR